MNGISHKQALQWIDRRLDGLLTEEQISLLEAHLAFCEACRAHAAEIESLPARLQNEFHARWDEEPGPSQKVMRNVTAQARRIPMANRISSGAKLFAGAVTLIVVGLAINFVVAQLQSTSITAAGTETVSTLPRAEDRLLAFASNQNGNYDIYAMHADGSGLTNLTNNPAYEANPFWSPDGSRIVFESDRTGSKQIYLMDSDGSHIVQLTNEKVDHGLPLNFDGRSTPWSPDGSKLLFFQTTSQDNVSTLYSMDIQGGNKTELASGRISFGEVSWSPDGKYIAYVLNDSLIPRQFMPDTYVIDSNGNNLRELKKFIPENEYLASPSYYWLSSGQSIMFTAFKSNPLRQFVYKFALETNTILNKAETKPIIADWREDTSLIMDVNQTGAPYIWERSDGTSNTLEASKTWGEHCSLDITHSLASNYAFGVYCPVTKFKLYWTTSDGSTIKQILDLPIDVDTGGVGVIAWSPDDRYIAFNLGSSNKTNMYVLDIDKALAGSSQPIQIPIGGVKFYGIPSWQPAYTPKLADNSSKLVIDPQSCKPASQLDSALRPPNELYGHDLIQGTSLVAGEFSYDFWLYCDPMLKPNDKEHFSGVAGVGIYASWRYSGPKVDGPVEYYFGFEPPNDVLGKSGSDGPLYKASAQGKLGIAIPETTVREYIQRGRPIQFHTVVDSSLGHQEAILSFRLEQTEHGLKIADVHTEKGHLSSVDDRLIAFASAAQSNNIEIYTMRPDGSELKNITNDPAHDANPFWSPDGTRIAFESDRNGFTQIYVMDTGGSNVVQVTGGEIEHHFGNSNPWSPDGSRLLFTEKASGDGWALYSIGVDGQDKTLLTQVPDIYSVPSWSPDGKHIAFIAREQQGDRQMARIHVVDAGGGNLTDATQRLPVDEDLISWQYTWSPDGQFLSFIAGRTAWDSSAGTSSKYAAYQASLDGETLTQKATSSTPMASWWEGTAFVTGFSPSTLTWLHSDGTYNTFQPLANCSSTENAGFSEKQSANGPLLFSVNCSSEELWFYWANAEGTEVKQLFDFPIPAKGGGVSDFIWSPDDKYAAISVTSSGINYMYMIDIEATLKDSSRQPVQIALYGDVLSSNLSWQPLP